MSALRFFASATVSSFVFTPSMKVETKRCLRLSFRFVNSLIRSCCDATAGCQSQACGSMSVCSMSGHLPLHIQQIWVADAHWQLQLLFELVGYLYAAQHRLVDVIGCCCIQLGSCLPKATCCKVAFFSFISSLPPRRLLCQFLPCQQDQVLALSKTLPS